MEEDGPQRAPTALCSDSEAGSSDAERQDEDPMLERLMALILSCLRCSVAVGLRGRGALTITSGLLGAS